MAVVKGSLHSGQATGAVGGLSYSADQYGQNVKGNISPNDPRSEVSSDQQYQVLTYCSYQFHNLSLPTFAKWINYSETHMWRNSLGQTIKLSPGNWYKMFCIPARLYFDHEGELNPPIDGQKFIPAISCQWTSSGIQLTFDADPSSNQAIVVWQHRNLRATQVRYNTLQRSHIIKYPSTSPFLVSGAILAQNDPPGFPVLLDNTYTNLKIRCYTVEGVASPILTFRIHVDD
jgi:hypothetical protein